MILAGGRGERFWPLSQPDFPKQLLDIFGHEPLLIQTLHRIKKFIDAKHRIMIVPEELRRITRQYVGNENLIIEPYRRNTGPAICLAAMQLLAKHGDGIMHVMPSDHMIGSRRNFVLSLQNGEKFAHQGYLVTYGIRPDRPETGYGYIRIGRRIASGSIRAHSGIAFIEKPGQRRARLYVRSKKYLWNSGIFSFRITAIIEAFKKHLPDVYRNLHQYCETGGVRFFRLLRDISIDYGLMEKSNKFCVITAQFKWDDVGSWLALERYHRADRHRNIIQGDIKVLDTTGSIMYTSGVPLKVYGVNNMVIVASPTGVLVCRKNRAPDLKNLTSLLQ